MKNYISSSSINTRLSHPSVLVNIAEENYFAYVQDAAADILAHSNDPLILLSGPSGSGKTTTAHRIADALIQRGARARVLSMDNYFRSIDSYKEEEIPRDEEGNVDLESPLRLNIPLFSEHLKKLAAGEEVNMPIFDFATQKVSGDVPLRRGRNEFLIIEGIHALNPMVTNDADSFCTCIYVSVRTRIQAGTGSVLHPRQIRLLRRICRDKLFRDRRPDQVFDMYKSVTRGEEKFIMPFKTRADIEIDTFMAHEPPVYKAMIYNELLRDKDLLSKYENYGQIMEFLSAIDEIDPSYIPERSLIREFIGDLGR